jgi:hypothetical protein
MFTLETNGASAATQRPVREVAIIIDSPNEKADVLAAIREFSDKNGFAARVASTSPEGDYFSVQLWREDIKIIGGNAIAVRPVNDIRLYFYHNGEGRVDDSVFDLAVSKLLSYFAGVTGVRAYPVDN